LRRQVPEMTSLMERAILHEVPRYRGDPERYGKVILQLCRLATRLFLRILRTGQPPGRREVAVVQRVGANVANAEEPLEPLLHALRIGARVGWQETLRVSQTDPDVPTERMLLVAGQVFEYIDELSSRIAEAYALQVEESTRARARSESALFEDLVAGRVALDPITGISIARPRVALALAAKGSHRAATHAVADVVAGRLRTRLPGAVVGQRHGLAVWLLAREPLAQLLVDCAAGDDVAFGLASASEDLPLSRAVDEAVEAARLGLELDRDGRLPVFTYAELHPYAALRADPGGLARSQQALLGPLLGRPVLLQTLWDYFESGRSISATAERVHRHRQSVIYRMRRIAELLRIRLDDAETMFRLEAAVRSLPRG